jgi:hypothetical protein
VSGTVQVSANLTFRESKTALVHFHACALINNVRLFRFETSKWGVNLVGIVTTRGGRNLIERRIVIPRKKRLTCSDSPDSIRGDYLAHLPSQVHWKTMTRDIRFKKPNAVPASEMQKVSPERWRMDGVKVIVEIMWIFVPRNVGILGEEFSAEWLTERAGPRSQTGERENRSSRSGRF